MNSLKSFYRYLATKLSTFFTNPGAPKILILPSGFTSATLPIDDVNTPAMCNILESSCSLGELHLLPPMIDKTFSGKETEIWDTLQWFLEKNDDLKCLERVSFTLDLQQAGHILHLLGRLPGVSSVELITPKTFVLNSRAEVLDRTFLNGIETQVESFERLEELIIPEQLVAGTFEELLERMFDSKSTLTGERVRYHNRARNLLYRTPIFLLPGA